jgi:hypothetical protein
VYRREVIVDDQGRYRFVVPYPTDVRFSPDVTVPRSYRIRGPRASGKLDVREQDVIGGATLRGPDLEQPVVRSPIRRPLRCALR